MSKAVSCNMKIPLVLYPMYTLVWGEGPHQYPYNISYFICSPASQQDAPPTHAPNEARSWSGDSGMLCHVTQVHCVM